MLSLGCWGSHYLKQDNDEHNTPAAAPTRLSSPTGAATGSWTATVPDPPCADAALAAAPSVTEPTPAPCAAAGPHASRLSGTFMYETNYPASSHL